MTNARPITQNRSLKRDHYHAVTSRVVAVPTQPGMPHPRKSAEEILFNHRERTRRWRARKKEKAEPKTTRKKIGRPKKYTSREDILAAGRERTRKFRAKKKATQKKETRRRETRREPTGVQNAAGQDTTKTSRHGMGTRSRDKDTRTATKAEPCKAS